ncbi:hypothetical protein [Streptomyces misionensis]|uniref:hypothetical protein n=1 Tax=Streptomyces misionensis TaxID=67331 RepID=UPI0036FEA329
MQQHDGAIADREPGEDADLLEQILVQRPQARESLRESGGQGREGRGDGRDCPVAGIGF